MFFDRDGQPITGERWALLGEQDRVIASDFVGDFTVSTVWLGLDPDYEVAPNTFLPTDRQRALIFETLAWRSTQGPSVPFSQRRYVSEALAREGHALVVNELRQLVAKETP